MYITSPYWGPLLANFVIGETYQWQDAFWLGVSVNGISLLLILTFLGETVYSRDLPSSAQPARGQGFFSWFIRLTGLWQMKHHSGYFESIFYAYKRVLLILSKPVILLVLLAYFMCFAWAIGVNISTAILFGLPQAMGGYGYSFTQLHNGVFEPEARLTTIYISAIPMIAGLVWMGQALHKHLSVAAIVVGWGMHGFGIMLASVAVASYLLDAYPSASAEVCGLTNVFRALSGFSVGYYQQPWGAKVGYDLRFKSGQSLFLSLMVLTTTVASPVFQITPLIKPGFAPTFIETFAGYPGSLPSSENWLFDLGTSYPGGAERWGNNEFETYTNDPSNVHITKDQNLAITPRFKKGNWTSARIETQRSDFVAEEGGQLLVEARLKLGGAPASKMQGIWPAFWALGSEFRGNYTNWPMASEWDILEAINGESTFYSTIHCGFAPGGPCNEYSGIGSGGRDFSRGEFHTLGFMVDRSMCGKGKNATWRDESLNWFLDGKKVFNVTGATVGDKPSWVQLAHKEHFLLLNVAVGGNWPGAPNNATIDGPSVNMEVDYPQLATAIALQMVRGDLHLFAHMPSPQIELGGGDDLGTEKNATSPTYLGNTRAPPIHAVKAAQSVINAASEEERGKLLRPVDAPEWRFCINPEIYVFRHGVRLEEDSENLVAALHALMQASLSAEGYKKAHGCMKVNQFLGEVVNGTKVLNENSYNFVIFGTPSPEEPRGCQIFGDHLCMNCFIVGTQMVVSPVFMGAEPNIIDKGPREGLELFVQKDVQICNKLSGDEYPPGRWHRQISDISEKNALVPQFGPETIAEAVKRLDTTVVDIVVDNAVLANPAKAIPIKDTTLNVFLGIMQANIYTPVSITTALLTHLPDYRGQVINISSILAYQANSDPTVVYRASKTALQSYTRAFTENFSKLKKATFNSVIVGLTATDSIKARQHMMPPGFLDGQIQDTTAGERTGVPDDIDYVVSFLASKEGH
ncbi:endo-1 3-beta-glucanase [Fusarium sp. NRRL 52700]|nr:endo-1 3-beta-glucanase [Fusarium sp. NRRL 52700]